MGALQRGDTPEQIVAAFDIPLAAIDEAVQLVGQYDYEKSYAGSW